MSCVERLLDLLVVYWLIIFGGISWKFSTNWEMRENWISENSEQKLGNSEPKLEILNQNWKFWTKIGNSDPKFEILIQNLEILNQNWKFWSKIWKFWSKIWKFWTKIGNSEPKLEILIQNLEILNQNWKFWTKIGNSEPKFGISEESRISQKFKGKPWTT